MFLSLLRGGSACAAASLAAFTASKQAFVGWFSRFTIIVFISVQRASNASNLDATTASTRAPSFSFNSCSESSSRRYRGRRFALVRGRRRSWSVRAASHSAVGLNTVAGGAFCLDGGTGEEKGSAAA